MTATSTTPSVSAWPGAGRRGACRPFVGACRPGIPPGRREEALRPFVRLDAARNQDAGGGAGLGLAIAMDVARAHGGTLRLGQSAALGGLLAEIVLPR